MLAALLAFWTTNAVADIAIWIVIVGGIIGIVYVALAVFEVHPPAWAVKMFWIVIVCVVAVMLIAFLANLASGPGPIFGR